jgi:PAS domain S-box-containing protein
LGSLTHTGLLNGSRGTFLLALAAVCLVAVADAALGAHAVLVEFLIVGPLIAAMRCSKEQTAVVALLAVAAAVPLGLATDAFGSIEHVTGVVAVAVGGALAAVIAHLRGRRERNAARLEVHYGVARVLAEAVSMEGSAERLLEAIAEPLGWELGHLWVVRGDTLEPVGAWTAPGVEVPDFEEATRQLKVRSGVGFAGQAWGSGRALFLADAVAARNFVRAESAERSGIRDGVAFPVVSARRTLAVIELFSRRPGEPRAEMLEVTTALGTLIGEFMERLRSAEAARQGEARKVALLASSLDGVIVIDHLGVVMEFNPAAVRMFGRTAEEAIGSELAELVIPVEFREAHRSALKRTVQTGESALIGQRVELTGMRADASKFPVELAITRIEGAEPPMFTGTVRDITERKRAEQERDELLRLEQLARLNASETSDQLEAILSGVADAVTAQAADGRLLFANQAAVELLGFESREALLSAPVTEIMARFEILDEHGDPFDVTRLPGRRALASGEPGEVIVRFRERGSGEERWSAIKAAPIRDADGEVTMAINVIEDITTHKRAEAAQRFLSESSAVLNSSLDPEEVLGQVARLAVPTMADWLFIDLARDGFAIDRVAVAHSDPLRLAQAERLYLAAPPARNATRGVPNVLRTARSELHQDLQEELENWSGEGPPYFRLARALGMRSAIVVPMSSRGRTFGALTLATDAAGRCFDEQDLELAEELARRCATAVDNARLFSERAYIARTLQQSLLPAELPDIPGIEAAARFRPTGEGNDVGGDFYDLFESGAGGWTIVMGDVCGKGPDAAAITALARYTLRAAAMRERLPSHSLHILNEALLRQRDDRRFCTVAYVHLQVSQGGAHVGCAVGGHPLPLLLRSNGAVEEVGAPGSLLGIHSDPDIEDRSASLLPGDALVFYTDGVIEGRGANGALDEIGLTHLLAACAGEGADAIAARVEDAALTASGGRPRDDIAVLVLRLAG